MRPRFGLCAPTPRTRRTPRPASDAEQVPARRTAGLRFRRRTTRAQELPRVLQRGRRRRGARDRRNPTGHLPDLARGRVLGAIQLPLIEAETSTSSRPKDPTGSRDEILGLKSSSEAPRGWLAARVLSQAPLLEAKAVREPPSEEAGRDRARDRRATASSRPSRASTSGVEVSRRRGRSSPEAQIVPAEPGKRLDHGVHEQPTFRVGNAARPSAVDGEGIPGADVVRGNRCPTRSRAR